MAPVELGTRPGLDGAPHQVDPEGSNSPGAHPGEFGLIGVVGGDDAVELVRRARGSGMGSAEKCEQKGEDEPHRLRLPARQGGEGAPGGLRVQILREQPGVVEPDAAR